jgi:hypothetical protein
MTEQSDQAITITNEEQAARVKADVKRANEPKQWRSNFAVTAGLAAAFANMDPAQGAGEAVFSVRDDGGCDMFLFF